MGFTLNALEQIFFLIENIWFETHNVLQLYDLKCLKVKLCLDINKLKIKYL